MTFSEKTYCVLIHGFVKESATWLTFKKWIMQ